MKIWELAKEEKNNLTEEELKLIEQDRRFNHFLEKSETIKEMVCFTMMLNSDLYCANDVADIVCWYRNNINHDSVRAEVSTCKPFLISHLVIKPCEKSLYIDNRKRFYYRSLVYNKKDIEIWKIYKKIDKDYKKAQNEKSNKYLRKKESKKEDIINFDIKLEEIKNCQINRAKEVIQVTRKDVLSKLEEVIINQEKIKENIIKNFTHELDILHHRLDEITQQNTNEHQKMIARIIKEIRNKEFNIKIV